MKNTGNDKTTDAVRRRTGGRTKRKLAVFFAAIVLILIGLTGRITYINAKSGEQYARQVLAQSQSEYGSTVLPFKRGDILDTNGAVLATSEKKYNVILDCKVVNSSDTYAEPTINALQLILDIPGITTKRLLTDDKTKDSQYQIILRSVSIEDKQRFENYVNGTDEEGISEEERKERKKIRGVWFEDTYERYYPFGTLACDVIGFTNGDNTADWGIEGYYSKSLNGVDGRKYGYLSSEGEVEQNIVDPKDGYQVISTLDVNIQRVVEREIDDFNTYYKNNAYETGKGAEEIGVIVMQPKTGRVLAMASSEPFDLNDPRDLSRFYTEEEIDSMNEETKIKNLQAVWRNFCVADAYEPGSVFKPVTMTAALMDASINENNVYYCDGGETVAGSYIKCAVTSGHGEETLRDVIRNSCNDAMMQIVSEMGVDEFCRYQKLFNFGVRTNIDLPGEATGIVFSANAMGDVDLATSAFGQGFTCTMIQEAAAFCSIVNGGYYYQPQIVKRITTSDGSVIRNYEPVLLKQTISEDISAEMREYLHASVLEGTSQSSAVPGYETGGKTGTAQKLPRGNGKYLVSFICAAPIDDPELLIYVVVDEPNVEAMADSRYAQWMAKAILTEVLPYMNLYPEIGAESEDLTELIPWHSLTVIEPNEDGIMPDMIEDTNVPSPQDYSEGEDVIEANEEEAFGYTNDDIDWDEEEEE